MEKVGRALNYSNPNHDEKPSYPIPFSTRASASEIILQEAKHRHFPAATFPDVSVTIQVLNIFF